MPPKKRVVKSATTKEDLKVLEENFHRAVKTIQGLPPEGEYTPSVQEKLAFYSLFKQATIGKNKTKKPAFYDVVGRTKWEAWAKLKNMNKETAMKKYIQLYLKGAKKMNRKESIQEIKEIKESLKAFKLSNNDNPVKIYATKLSQPSRSVIWFCILNNIPYEFINVDLSKGQHLKPEFLKLNPHHKVPVIEHNGKAIYESHTILRYLALTFGTPDHWYPSDTNARLTTEQYLDWHHLNTRQAMMQLVFSKVLAPMRGINVSEKQIKQQIKQVHTVLTAIDTIFLNDTPYLSANEISIADILCYGEIVQLKLTPEVSIDSNNYPNVVNWMNRLEQLDGYSDVHSTLLRFASSVSPTSKL